MDPIADMLSRIRNALSVRRPAVDVPYSKTKFAIAKILEREGWVSSAVKDDASQGIIRLFLKYDEAGQPHIRALRRVSRPGQRRYVPKSRLPTVLGGLGVAIVSTPSGIMTNKEARKRGLGGEVMCEIH